MLTDCSSVVVAGANGMVGSAIVRALGSTGINSKALTRAHVDLTCQSDVQSTIERLKPDYLFIAAARVGGIHANNTYPAEFIYENLMIECNLIKAAFDQGCRQLLFLGSSCIYPRYADQPMRESELLSGLLEPTNEPYAVAKIAGIKLCESFNRQYDTDYRCLMPTNLYGQGDNFHAEDSHVIPALMRRFHEAKENQLGSVTVWGSGTPRREFLHVDDLASGSLALADLDKHEFMAQVDPMLSHLNIGTGTDLSIRELAESIARVVGYDGKINFDASKPDGAPRKLLNTDKLKALGWQPRIDFDHGLGATYDWYLENLEKIRS
jgi:GDP-L-fucose synthase